MNPNENTNFNQEGNNPILNPNINNNPNMNQEPNMSNSNLGMSQEPNMSNNNLSMNQNPNMDVNRNNQNTIPTLGNNNDGNMNSNVPSNKNPFSTKKILIIVSVVIVLVVIAILLFIFFGNSTNSGNTSVIKGSNSGNTSAIKNSNIKQISMTEKYVLMLEEQGDLYICGEYDIGTELYEEPTKIASNVKYFDDYGRLIIVDKDDTAYYVGLDIDGWGSTKEFELVTNNIKKITSSNFCFFIIDKDNNYIVEAPIENNNTKKYCALPEEFDGNFSKIASNAKEIWSSRVGVSNGYLTNDNDLYVSSAGNVGYIKVLSNVNKVSRNYAITKDGELYYLDINEEGKTGATKLRDNVTDIYDVGNIFMTLNMKRNIYKTTNNEFYCVEQNQSDLCKLEEDDIKVPYYYKDNKLVYLNNNNKLILKGEGEKKELKISIESMKQIYDFVK